MNEAKKSPVFGRLFRLYNRALLRRHFAVIHVGGMHHIEGLDRALPMIFFGNHSSWWDGMVEHFLSTDVLKADCFAMMEEKQFVKYRFFRKIGAFSVNRESARDGVIAMQYAAGLFNHPNRLLWIYPQGRMLPNAMRPLQFYNGLARIVQMIGRKVQAVPFARKYEFLREQRPEVFTLFGEPIVLETLENVPETTRVLQETVTSMLDDVGTRIARQSFQGFIPVLRGRTSINVMYDGIRFKK